MVRASMASEGLVPSARPEGPDHRYRSLAGIVCLPNRVWQASHFALQWPYCLGMQAITTAPRRQVAPPILGQIAQMLANLFSRVGAATETRESRPTVTRTLTEASPREDLFTTWATAGLMSVPVSSTRGRCCSDH